MKNSSMVKNTLVVTVVLHTLEAMVAYRAAAKRGKNPKVYYALTQVFGVFVLIPLLRKPKTA
ncbi:MAG TPA: DUF4499 domain-containing protein [Candidatus Anoxymicrobiaceae bacterium]